MNDYIKVIQKDLLKNILNGVYKPGERIPTEMELAKRFQSNRMNAQLAVRDLERRGFVTRQRRKGTFVNSNLSKEKITQCLARTKKNIHVLLFAGKTNTLHWDKTTFNVMESSLNEKGYTIIYKEIDRKNLKKDLEIFLKELREEGCAGLVVFPYAYEELFSEKESFLEILDIPVYLFDKTNLYWNHPSLTCHRISLDPFYEGVMLGRSLAGERMERIIYFENVDSHFAELRKDGLRAGLKRESSWKGELIVLKDVKLLLEEIENGVEPPVVVFPNDARAVMVIDLLEKEGLKYPRDYYVIGFDNNPAYRSYNLTTVAPPLEKIGELFSKLILDKTWVTDDNLVTIRVSSSIIERKSFRFSALINQKDAELVTGDASLTSE